MTNESTYRHLIQVLEEDQSSVRVRSRLQSLSNDFFSSHCTNPIKVVGVDYFTGAATSNYYNCGRCDHCRNIKSNELLTRIYLDLPLQGYLYFVTLTYTSVYPNNKGDYYGYKDVGSRDSMHYVKYKLNTRVMDTLRDKVLHMDDHNIKRKKCYSTCLLDLSDFSDFIKRLRKSLPSVRFQYCVFGEYGHKFGRPHMHALISSNQPIPLNEFRDAWSIYGCSIGNCYVDDITSSGSVNATTKYVTKYISKKEEFNDYRVKLAYRLSQPFDPSGDFNYLLPRKFYEPRVVPREYIPDEEPTYINGQVKIKFYEEDYESYHDFKRAAVKRPRYSIRNCFGSLYYSANSGRFLEGNEGLPSSSSFSVVFPQYFRRKVRKTKYPLCFYKTSINESHYFVQASYPSVVRSMQEFYSSRFGDPRMPFHHTFNSDDFKSRISIPNSLVLYKYDTGEYLLPQSSCFVGYKYDRHQRCFVQTNSNYTLTYLYKLYLEQSKRLYEDELALRINKDYNNKIYELLIKEHPDVYASSVENESRNWSNIRQKSISKIIQSKYNSL